jgi:exonuclease VII small subunit
VDVDGVETRLELGLVFLKMVGKYLELLADVARNTGYVWVHIANTYADKIMDYEAQLREAAESIDNNDAIIEKLDLALSELESARSSIDYAENEYQQVIIPGTPILKFANGNQYLRTAKNHLISAQGNLKQAFRLLSEAN